MNQLRFLGLLAAGAAATTFAVAAPAEAAVKVTGTVKPIARSCSTPRVAHFKIVLKHLRIGEEYLVEWTAPTRSGGTEVTQIPIVASKAQYNAANVASRGATPLLLRRFPVTIDVYAEQPKRKQTVKVLQQETTASVPPCTPRN
jgi:hypothetical protein